MLGVVGKQLALVRMRRTRRSAPSGSHQADTIWTPIPPSHITRQRSGLCVLRVYCHPGSPGASSRRKREGLAATFLC